jgi:uncharacterized protein YdeI (YjbR/CyaY-like superfamily)
MARTIRTLELRTRREWRSWLQRHHDAESEIWLVFPKRHTGERGISDDAAVEEALCFGWIDSIVRTIDETKFAQRFSPRKPGSKYSPANKERLRSLLKKKKVIKEVRETLGDLADEKFIIADDILAELKSNSEAWKNFQKFSDAYKRIRIGFIEGARKRPAEFKKRLAYFIRMTEKDRQFGFGGIEKHY